MPMNSLGSGTRSHERRAHAGGIGSIAEGSGFCAGKIADGSGLQVSLIGCGKADGSGLAARAMALDGGSVTSPAAVAATEVARTPDEASGTTTASEGIQYLLPLPSPPLPPPLPLPPLCCLGLHPPEQIAP